MGDQGPGTHSEGWIRSVSGIVARRANGDRMSAENSDAKDELMNPDSRCTLGLSLLLLIMACDRPPEPPPAATPALAGTWRAVLSSPGGELPFTLRLDDDNDAIRAVAVSGAEEVPFSSVERRGSDVVLRFAWYDSEISARIGEGGERLTGTWRKTVPEGDSTLPFTAERGAAPRFRTPSEEGLEGGGEAVPSVAGTWSVVFADEDGTEPARGEFVQDGERVTGTFLTPTGDYRFLEGSYTDGLLRLSTFDGAHAFLFHARPRSDGTLAGDFWSRDSYHASWTAKRIDDDVVVLPDAWSAVGLTNDEGRFSFAFPDLDGNVVSLADPRFTGKVVVVNVFGSWCPNCNDEAPLLARWYRAYAGRGLEVVGLAYELTGDPERDRELLRRFAERHGVGYPLLLAGTSDKQAAGETLPDLTGVLAFPTTLFVGLDGTVRKIHSGFSGPGTGEHYTRLVAELEGELEKLIAE